MPAASLLGAGWRMRKTGRSRRGDGAVVDEGLDESFALVVRSVSDDPSDVSGCVGEGGGVGLLGFDVDLCGELLAAAA